MIILLLSMEAKYLENKMRDWACSLGFRLPDGGLPKSDFFATMTATPSRRELCKLLIESVQPRNIIAEKRKKLIVSKLKTTKRKGKNEDFKHVSNKFELYQKQILLEEQVEVQRTNLRKVNQSFMSRASDTLFEICKLAEFEKHSEELQEKTLVLKMFIRRQHFAIEVLDQILSKLNENGQQEESLKQLIDKLSKECADLDFSFDFRNITNECLLAEVVKCKKLIIEKFTSFLEELNVKDKKIFSEKQTEIEKNLQSLIVELKQVTVEKSLLAILNETEIRKLNLEINKLEEKLHGLYFKDEFQQENALVEIINDAKIKGKIAQKKFLENELKKLEDVAKTKEEPQNEEEYQRILKRVETLRSDIHSIKTNKEEQDKNVKHKYNQLEILTKKASNEVNEENYQSELQEIVTKLKTCGTRQIELFLETPSDAFKTVETSSGNKFECESLPLCMNNYGGEFRKFFSSVLISPYQEMNSILKKLEIKKQEIEKRKNFSSEWQRILESKANILSQLSSLKCDSQICMKNVSDSEEILRNLMSKAVDLGCGVEFLGKILKNWAEQPYRLMIGDMTIHGKTLKKWEEKYKAASKQ